MKHKDAELFEKARRYAAEIGKKDDNGIVLAYVAGASNERLRNNAKLNVGGSLPFSEDEMKKVQAGIDEVNNGSKIDMRKLMNVDVIDMDELSQLLHDCNQLISGFAMDEVWSEWDESVRQRLVQMQIKVNDVRGQ